MTATEIADLGDIAVSLAPTGVVVSGFSLRLLPGHVVALLGENGGGKTTLLRVAGGLLPPNEGSVRILGEDLLRRPQSACEHLYSVIEPTTPYDFLTVRQYLAVHGAIYPQWDGEAALRYCRDTAVPEDRPITTLSRGQRLKTRLACAFASGARFLVLDEPFESLDATSRAWLRLRLAECRAGGRNAILYSAHRDEDSDGIASGTITLA